MFTGRTKRKTGTERYRAKASRRPVRFWWQAFATLGITICLWSQLPVGAVFYSAQRYVPLPAPCAAYVALEPADALSLLRRARSGWMAGGSDALAPSFVMDLGWDELRESLPPPSFLEDGGGVAGEWSPSAVGALPQPASVVPAPSVSREVRAPLRLAPQQGVRFFPDAALSALSFSADVDVVNIPKQEGHARFYVETGEDGRVEHVLALTPLEAEAILIERALSRGGAKGAGSGFVEVYWKNAKR